QEDISSAVERLSLPKGSLADETEEAHLFSGWEGQARRHVGTLVHKIFEQIGRFGPEVWLQKDVQQQDSRLKRQLAALGVPAHELSDAITRIHQAVDSTLDSQQGAWILQNHSDGACELELSGQVDGQVVHAVIDRTFVDAEGIRWVIDYKTSTPQGDENIAAFIQRESEHYRGQLAGYVQLLVALEPQRAIRSALYFPLIDRFVEVADVQG
ncbi:MAG: PD-(D/E)XK nuclease family protein, partial [Geopsychrobacter sp.]|nr:PD-(D/E)XK nuclease family protein [Geopsychrobacter sp.]